jgi:hypothetical protein
MHSGRALAAANVEDRQPAPVQRRFFGEPVNVMSKRVVSCLSQVVSLRRLGSIP